VSSQYEFRSAIAPVLNRYVALKHSLGRALESAAYCLARLDLFLVSQQPSDLTATTFSAWCSSMASLTPSTRRQRLLTVYQLCLYRRRTEANCFVPDPTQFPPAQPRLRPYIFTESEITRILSAAETLPPGKPSPLQQQVARVAVVLLYTTGIRRGEVIRLTLGDYDPVEKFLLVREGKFHKPRILPLSEDAIHEMDHYLLDRRSTGFPRSADSPLLLNNHGGLTGYTGPGLASLIRRLFRQANIRQATGRLPRVHDLRFTFAVHALVRWYRAGVDVQARLPSLSMYMGHVSVTSTQYYLSFVDAIAQAASEKFDQHCSHFFFRESCEGGAR
jgi:integrase/recombinase XerD